MSASVFLAAAVTQRPPLRAKPAEHSAHASAPRQRAQFGAHAAQAPRPRAPYSPTGHVAAQAAGPPAAGRKRLGAAHATHAVGSAGAVHVLQVPSHGAHELPPWSAAKPSGQAARQAPPKRKGVEPDGSQAVHAWGSGPSQLLHVGSHAPHVDVPSRRAYCCGPQLGRHAPPTSTGLIHGAARHVRQTLGAWAVHAAQSYAAHRAQWPLPSW